MSIYKKLNDKGAEWYRQHLSYPNAVIMHPLDVYIMLQDMIETTTMDEVTKNKLYDNMDEMLTQHNKMQRIVIPTQVGKVPIYRSYDVKEGDIVLV